MVSKVPPKWQRGRKVVKKLSGGVESVLASLFRKILMETGIGMTGLTRLIVAYLNVLSRRQNISDHSSARGNLTKELLGSTMTFKVFMKAMSVLNIRKIRITVLLTHSNNRETEHFVDVILGQHAGENEGSDPETVLTE